MEYLLKSNSSFLTLRKAINKLPATLIVLSILFSSILLFLALKTGISLYIILSILTIPFLLLIILYPRIYVYGLAAFSVTLAMGGEEGVSIIDVVTGGYYFSFTIIWMIWQISVKKEKLVQNIADWLVIFFFIVLIFYSLISIFNDVPLLDFVREYVLYATLLCYFPIKHYITERKHFKILLLIIAVAIIVSTFLQLYLYQTRILVDAVYAYQVGGGIKTNIMIFSASTVFGLIFTSYSKSKIQRFVFLVFTLFSVIGLISTFSRAIWLIAIFNVFAIIFYVGKVQRIRIITFLSVILVLFRDRKSVV